MLMNIAPAALLAWCGILVNLVGLTMQCIRGAGISAVLLSAGLALFVVLFPILWQIKALQGYLPLLLLLTAAASYHSACEQYVRADGDTALYAAQGLLNTLLVVTLNLLLLKGFRLGVAGYALSVALADLLCTVFLVGKKRL